MPRLFLSYRRDDSQDVTGRIHDRLADRFGIDAVFMDIDTIPFGLDFRRYLSDSVAGCDAVLVVIGPRWLDAVYIDGPKAGQRRLDDPTDFVRIEVAAALARGIPVVPVLVGGASIPPPERLPADLTDLAFRNAAEVRSGRDFHGHMKRLIGGLEQVLARPVAPPPPLPQVPAVPVRVPPVARVPVAPRVVMPIAVAPPAVAAPTNLSFDAEPVDRMPPGWFNSVGFVGGVSPDYEIALRTRPDSHGPCVRLRKKSSDPSEFGSLMQRCPAGPFIGQVVRFEGMLRTECESGWAGLWLRIDGVDGQLFLDQLPSPGARPGRPQGTWLGGQLFFNNMHDRPIRGTTTWKQYSIETTVPPQAEWLNYGILLVGDGSLWAADFAITIVGRLPE